jgi:hypothetical protein
VGDGREKSREIAGSASAEEKELPPAEPDAAEEKDEAENEP